MEAFLSSVINCSLSRTQSPRANPCFCNWLRNGTTLDTALTIPPGMSNESGNVPWSILVRPPPLWLTPLLLVVVLYLVLLTRGKFFKFTSELPINVGLARVDLCLVGNSGKPKADVTSFSYNCVDRCEWDMWPVLLLLLLLA